MTYKIYSKGTDRILERKEIIDLIKLNHLIQNIMYKDNKVLHTISPQNLDNIDLHCYKNSRTSILTHRYPNILFYRHRHPNILLHHPHRHRNLMLTSVLLRKPSYKLNEMNYLRLSSVTPWFPSLFSKLKTIAGRSTKIMKIIKVTSSN